ncbi:LuxR C-terminal-related transcriptional regulator [Streptomyces sp. S.PB5]|uniref:LuxR C-terminal-related transcriptional regulator n=1 Tax=Streptomyces sp. S.PB5 TaxID=3020844 RepID=UPI0025B0B116|nr:LuxR C-terminal-related transcriptional regulator [Streptomyces sp. S.PB5]MDN3025587.1 LuxR C-terminal-related transcriptional regulator [Streptomyces sp. S.PB5]
MTTFERDAKTLELPWPFTGRENELELIRRSSAAGHHGIVVTGPAGCGKTRLVTEAVRGTDCARVAGTPEIRHIPFAAFAHLLPEAVSLHRAVQLLSAVRLLLVDDAHLLDDASAALVHQLAVHGRTRLLVVATDGTEVPGAVSRLWTGELLPRLALEPLPHEETAQLLTAGAGGGLEPLTANRLHRLCQGDLRLLRDLLGAVREAGLLARVPGTDEWAWRGPVPVTATVRERTAQVLNRADRETLELLAFAEPLPLHLDGLDLRVLEDLEADGLVLVDDHGTVHLADPLHGPVLRAAAGRLRARRLARTPEECKAALETEAAALSRRIERADVRESCAPVGEWLVAEGAPVPAAYAAVRARFSRLRGELREAAAWAGEGLRDTAGDPACRAELALAVMQSGETTDTDPGADPRVAAWLAAARGDIDGALEAVTEAYDAVRLGTPGKAPGAAAPQADRLAPASGRAPAGESVSAPHAGGLAHGSDPAPAGQVGSARQAGEPTHAEESAPRRDDVFALHADALARADGPALDLAAGRLEERGFLLFAAEAYAQAVHAHRDPRAARTSRTRAVALAGRCQGARTPALSGLVLGELTARQRQIVTLAAAGLSNRQIAEKLTLSIRTVGNHLYSAYARLGAGGRGSLPWLVELPTAQSA